MLSGLQTQCLCHTETLKPMKEIDFKNNCNTEPLTELSKKAHSLGQGILTKGQFSWQEGLLTHMLRMNRAAVGNGFLSHQKKVRV